MKLRLSGVKVAGAVIAASTLLAATGCSGGSAAGAKGDATVKLGLISAEQGNFAFAGKSYLRGAQLAAEEINSSSSLGDRTLDLEVEEGSEDPQQSITALNKLTSSGDVAGVVCCISSAVAGALKPMASAKKIPLIVYGATAPDIEDPPYVYRPALLPQQGITPVTQTLVKKLGLKTAVHMAVVDNDGLKAQMEAARDAATAAGAKNLGVVETLLADTDFSGAVTQALAKQPDLITVYLLGEQAATVVKSLRERGYKGVILANNAIATEQNLKSFGKTLAGTYYSVEYFPTSTVPEAQTFTKAYKAKYGETPDVFASQGYTAVKYAAMGIAKTGAGETSPESLGQALKGITSMDSVWGEISFENGQGVSHHFQIVKMDAQGQPALWDQQD